MGVGAQPPTHGKALRPRRHLALPTLQIARPLGTHSIQPLLVAHFLCRSWLNRQGWLRSGVSGRSACACKRNRTAGVGCAKGKAQAVRMLLGSERHLEKAARSGNFERSLAPRRRWSVQPVPGDLGALPHSARARCEGIEHPRPDLPISEHRHACAACGL